MKKEIGVLNFSKIIKYLSIRGYSKNRPFRCTGFCIDCEEKKILHRGEFLTQISHGADSSDYRKIIKQKYSNNRPIMFVFENPGSEFTEEVAINGITKNVPINHYYWINDDIIEPPSTPEELIKIRDYRNIYDQYIVYLQKKFNLNNIYVTNLTKCKLRKNKKEWRAVPYKHIRDNCIEHIFKKELEIFRPELIFCMGVKTFNWFPRSLCKTVEVVRLSHPAKRISNLMKIKENDKIIKKTLKDFENRKNGT